MALAEERTFDELYAVSDLHLGGVGLDHQIFKDGARLAAFIRARIEPRKNSSVALVLNGDVVDFLAEDKAAVFDPSGAISKLGRIIGDPAFTPVWDALRAYVASDPLPDDAANGVGTPVQRRTLIFVLGNHDIELAMPNVQAWLESWLARDDDAARGRVVWATQGAGFSALVGGRRVLCLHGNEGDEWNLVDHLALLQAARAYNRGLAPPEWRSNAGSQLVIDVMNPIKAEKPFVDLLKPEMEAAVPILAALRPEALKKIGAAASLKGRSWVDSLRRWGGFLGEDESTESVATREQTGEELVREMLMKLDAEAAPATDVERKIRYLQQRIESQRERLSVNDQDGYLGGDTLFGKTRNELLRAALRSWLGSDQTFNVHDEDKPFKQLKALVGSDVHYLVAGHTHLRRALTRQGNGCYYYNTGTWIRLIQLDRDTLKDRALFQEFIDLLQISSLQELDKQKTSQGKLVVRVEPTAAHIFKTPTGACGTLNDVKEDGSLNPIDKTRFESP